MPATRPTTNVLAVLAVALALTGCGSETASTTTVTEATTTTLPTPVVYGTIALGPGDFSPDSEICIGDGGFGDMRTGASVVVKDGDGDTIGTSGLGTGLVEEDEETGVLRCVFLFEVGLVRDAPFYTVEVAGRAGPTYSHSDMVIENWTVALSVR